MLVIIGEHFGCGQLLRIEISQPVLIVPSRGADADLCRQWTFSLRVGRTDCADCCLERIEFISYVLNRLDKLCERCFGVPVKHSSHGLEEQRVFQSGEAFALAAL